jgi:preprotein translocase subunit SecF
MQPGDGAAMGAHPIRPARFWYWVAGAAAVAAVVWLALSLFLGFRSLSRQVEGFQRAPIPGHTEVSFDEPGGYTLYFEGLGASDEQATIPSFNMSLTPVGSGEEVSIRDYGGSATYGFAGHSGRALGTFRIEEPGRFLLRTEAEPQGVEANVAVGPSVGPAIFRTVMLAITGTLVLLLGGAVLAVVVTVRRDRARHLLPAPAVQSVATRGQGTASAGWFADPGRRHELRYWDGQRWTEHVSDRGTQGVDPI